MGKARWDWRQITPDPTDQIEPVCPLGYTQDRQKSGVRNSGESHLPTSGLMEGFAGHITLGYQWKRRKRHVNENNNSCMFGRLESTLFPRRFRQGFLPKLGSRVLNSRDDKRTNFHQH